MNYYKQQGRCNGMYNMRDNIENDDSMCNCNMNNNEEHSYMNNGENVCRCLNDLTLGIAYVPWQTFGNTLCAKEGLENGTIFSELIFPFYGCEYKKRGGCR